MKTIEYNTELCVVGGGLAGMCTAIAAARHGIKCVLIHNRAVLGGIVKIASKMGISTIQSYEGSQIFEAIGIDKDVINKYFPHTVCRVGGITIKDIEKTIKYPLSAKDSQGRLLCGAGVGITANVLDRVGALVDAKVDVVVLDCAHGHSENVLRCLRMIKEKYPDLQVLSYYSPLLWHIQYNPGSLL